MYACVASNVHWVWYFSIGIAYFLFMKYSFIKDLNGLEIVIMYISVLSVEHTKCQTHGKRTRCFGMLIVPWKYLRQELKKANA
jgi:hypothetical protein